MIYFFGSILTGTTYIIVCRIWSFLIQYRYKYWKRCQLW